MTEPSDPNDPNEPAALEPLQLDRADFGDEDDSGISALTCGRCGTPITDAYFEVNGAATCRGCHARLLAERSGGVPILRFLGAFALGFVAAVAGFLIYWAVLAWTGYEVALISILVGLIVGVAVKIGSKGRGGWLYQLMAVGLTYVSICASYVPVIVSQLEEEGGPAVEETAAAAEGGGPSWVEAISKKVLPEGDEAASEMGCLGAAVAVVTLAVLVLAIPFLAGIENILGLFIIGIGLYQAWKINRKPPFETAGPFEIGAGAAAPG